MMNRAGNDSKLSLALSAQKANRERGELETCVISLLYYHCLFIPAQRWRKAKIPKSLEGLPVSKTRAYIVSSAREPHQPLSVFHGSEHLISWIVDVKRRTSASPKNYLKKVSPCLEFSLQVLNLPSEALNHPRGRSPFNASPLPYTRQYLSSADGQSDVPEHNINQERSRKNRDSSNTWTESSLDTEVEDEEDRTEFVNEYNRLAEKACRMNFRHWAVGLTMNTTAWCSQNNS